MTQWSVISYVQEKYLRKRTKMYRHEQIFKFFCQFPFLLYLDPHPGQPNQCRSRGQISFILLYGYFLFYIIPAALVSKPELASITPGLLLTWPARLLSARSHKARYRPANGRQQRTRPTLWCHPGGLHGRLRRSGWKSEGAGRRQPRPRGAAAVSAAQVLAPPSWCVRS
jgi:hypothetical protein